MQTIQLTPDGPRFSALAYGTWRLLDGGATAQDINRRLHLCAELGLTTIDTAEIYGGGQVEAALGEALALSPGLRDRLQIVTKAGIALPSPDRPERPVPIYDATAERLVATARQALRRLRTDRLDLFLVHRPDWLTSPDDTAAGLDRLVREGVAACVGVSNYSPPQMEALRSRLRAPLATNQVEFSLLHMAPQEDGTFDLCQRERIRPMAWSPLGGGRLLDAREPAAGRLRLLAAELAERHDGASLDELALAWVTAHPSGPMPVIGTNRPERIRSAVRAAGLRLAREDWFRLWTAARGQAIP